MIAGPAAVAYDTLLPRIRNAAMSLRAEFSIIGKLEDFPLTMIRAGAKNARPGMLIDAGIHGDEPASSLGLIEWLEADAAAWLDRIRFAVLPCLNPYGLNRNTRGSRTSEDLNRQFDNPAAALTAILSRALNGERFDLVMDLHEDRDFAAFYLYELKTDPPFLGELLADEAKDCVPLSNDQMVGKLKTRNGLLRPEVNPAVLAARRGWPIAYYHFRNYSSHVVTVETPGLTPLDTRMALQRRLLNSACRFLAGPGDAS